MGWPLTLYDEKQSIKIERCKLQFCIPTDILYAQFNALQTFCSRKMRLYHRIRIRLNSRFWFERLKQIWHKIIQKIIVVSLSFKSKLRPGYSCMRQLIRSRSFYALQEAMAPLCRINNAWTFPWMHHQIVRYISGHFKKHSQRVHAIICRKVVWIHH